MKKTIGAALALTALVVFNTVNSVSATNQEFCSGGFSYTKSGDFSDSRVEIDFINTGSDGNPDTIKVEAKSGYTLNRVELDVEDDNQGGFYNYTANFPGTFNPNPGKDIDEAKVCVMATATATPTATPRSTVTPTPSQTPVSPTVTPTPTVIQQDPTATPTPTETPSNPPNVGGPGDGLSDGRSDGRSSCPECTAPPKVTVGGGQVLGATTDYAATGSAVDMLVNAIGALGAASTMIGAALMRKNK